MRLAALILLAWAPAASAPRPPKITGSSLLFVVGGDNRPTGKGAPMPKTTRTIFEEIGLIRPDLVLWTGDTVYGYGDTSEELAREYDRFQSLAGRSGVTVFNVPGNHEIHRTDDAPCSAPGGPGVSETERQFVRRFGALYESFDAGPVHFIALDTETFCREDRIDGEQLAWLEADLEAHKSASAIFVFSHTEFFSAPGIDSPHEKGHEPLRNRDELHDLFRRYPVKAVFSGHEHLYGRESRDGIEYFVAGGGGAPLYASPERGGFSHYLLVTVAGGEIRYDVLEPGHLSVETGNAAAGSKKFWIVNSNDADIPLRGVSLDAGGLGPCASLRVDSDLRRWDGTPMPVPVSRLSCARVRGRPHLTLGLTAPRGTSVPVIVSRER